MEWRLIAVIKEGEGGGEGEAGRGGLWKVVYKIGVVHVCSILCKDSFRSLDVRVHGVRYQHFPFNTEFPRLHIKGIININLKKVTSHLVINLFCGCHGDVQLQRK